MPGISGNAPSGNSALFQQLCKHTASHLHRALWAEFLTAEAVDTGLPVNIRLAAAHCDGFGRTDIGAFFAADAGACAKLGVRRKHMEQEAVGKLGENTLSAAAEKDASGAVWMHTTSSAAATRKRSTAGYPRRAVIPRPTR